MEGTVVVESVGDYKGGKKKERTQEKIKRGLPTNHKANLPDQAEMLVQRG